MKIIYDKNESGLNLQYWSLLLGISWGEFYTGPAHDLPRSSGMQVTFSFLCWHWSFEIHTRRNK